MVDVQRKNEKTVGVPSAIIFTHIKHQFFAAWEAVKGCGLSNLQIPAFSEPFMLFMVCVCVCGVGQVFSEQMGLGK